MTDSAVVMSLLVFLPMLPAGYVIPKLLVLFAGLVFCLDRGGWRQWDAPPLSAWVLLAVVALSTYLSVSPWISFWGLATRTTTGQVDAFYSKGLLEVIAYFIILGFPSKRPWLKWIGGFLSLHALAQRAGLDHIVPYLPSGRAVATLGSPVDLGAVLAMAAASIGLTPLLPLIVGGLWATGSRAAWLGAAVGLTPRRWLPIWALLLLVPFFRPMAAKDVARIEVWKTAERAWLEHPVLGSGPDTFILSFLRLKTPKYREAMQNDNVQEEAHNDILQALATVGILGAAAYLWFALPLVARSPALLALFIVAKFDPLSFEVLAAAALVAAGEIEVSATHDDN